MPRLRNPSAAQATATNRTTTSARRVLKEKTNTARAPVFSDYNLGELVRDAPKKRGRPKKTQSQEDEQDEYVMAGGLGPASEESVQPASDAPLTTDELGKSSDAPKPAARGNRRPARTVRRIVQSEAQSKVLDGLKQRMTATAKGQRAKAVVTSEADAVSSVAVPEKQKVGTSGSAQAERSEFSMSPSPPRAEKPSAVKRLSMAQPGSVMKVQMTPAVENSMLALKNFKRRPRQPSMLQMVQQRLGSARPSLANATTINADDDAVDDSSGLDLELDMDEDEDDFAPEAEGTPMHVSKKRRSTIGTSKSANTTQTGATKDSSGISKKRTSDQLDVSSGSLSALRAKRQKPVEEILHQADSDEGDNIIVKFSQQPGQQTSTRAAVVEADEIIVRSSSRRTETPQPAVASTDVEVINSPSSSSTPPTEPPSSRNLEAIQDIDDFVVPSTEREREADDGDENTQHVLADEGEASGLDEVMADPVSSPASGAARLVGDMLAEPTTQPSPAPCPAKTRPKKSKPMHTAALQSLLPKRRAPTRPRHRKSEYDFDVESESEDEGFIDTSHLADDEDELGGRPRRSKTKAASAKDSRPTRAQKTQTKRAAKAPAKKKPGPAKALRTYGRSNASDKENDGDDTFEEAEESTLPEISLSMQEASRSAELEAAKRKFADIDQWDIEFESMSGDAHRSSSPAWR